MSDESTEHPQILVLGPDGMAVAGEEPAVGGERPVTEMVEELERLSLPFADDVTPSEAELRVAQAQLVGWLEGLFHGIQTTLFAQQMAARAQLEQMRRALPPGPAPAPEAGQQMAARAQLEQMRRALPPGLLPAQEQEQQPLRGAGPYL